MAISVTFIGFFKELVGGKRQMTFKNHSTLLSLLREIAAHHNAFKEEIFQDSDIPAPKACSVILNGKLVSDIANCHLQDGDNITLFAPVFGGRLASYRTRNY
ncbi:MAG: MoaD/ThiS family protein [Promethearchaeota archaeon]